MQKLGQWQYRGEIMRFFEITPRAQIESDGQQGGEWDGSSHHGPDHGEAGVAVEEGRPELKEPGRYAVLLHNDDYSTMEFVIEVLQKFFRKSLEEATEITLKVHHEGRGVAGMYTHEIAETKAAQVVEYAQSRKFPLKASVEPA